MKAIIGNVYAVPSDFCGVFREETTALYSLALLLTADHAKAEQCFVTGFHDSVRSNRVFRQWAHSWSRRNIIKNAIQMIQPLPEELKGAPAAVPISLQDGSHIPVAAILRLEAFERFVYVMSVLEGYSAQDCAILLNCMREDVIAARTRALQKLSPTEAGADGPLTLGNEIVRAQEPVSLNGAA